jgi:hypothetical protein
MYDIDTLLDELADHIGVCQDIVEEIEALSPSHIDVYQIAKARMNSQPYDNQVLH